MFAELMEQLASLIGMVRVLPEPMLLMALGAVLIAASRVPAMAVRARQSASASRSRARRPAPAAGMAAVRQSHG